MEVLSNDVFILKSILLTDMLFKVMTAIVLIVTSHNAL